MDQEIIDRFNEEQKDAAEQQRLLDAISESALDISQTIVAAEKHTKNVNITNDLAKPSDIDKVVQAVRAIDLKPQDLQPIATALDQISQAITKLPTEYPEFPELPEAPEQREDVRVNNLNELKDYFQDVVKAIGALETSIKFDPKIEVKPADVVVNEKELDLTPVTKALTSLEKAFKSIKTPEFDLTELIETTDRVSQAVNGLTFPVANFVQDPYIQYKAVDEFDDGVATNVKYYGFLDPRGNWYILKNDPSASAKTYRYAFGDIGYEASWINRAGLTYGYPFGK